MSPGPETHEGLYRLLLQLRQAGVTDTRVLSAIERIPREMFVPTTFHHAAYDDAALPIGYQQTVSQPQVVARMTQALDVGERSKVLEVGTGSGYQAAILAKLCRRLYTVERHRPLLQEALKRFEALRLYNITAVCGDGTLGWPEQAPFDRILVTAAAIDVPPLLREQLAVGGTMVVPVGDDQRDQRILRVRRTEDDFLTEDLGAVRFVPLIPGIADS